MTGLDVTFHPTRFTDAELALRHEVRAFVRQEFPQGEYRPHLGFGGYSPEFSRKLAARGWVGMAIPREYGGRGRTTVERFIVVEELLRAGAPGGAPRGAHRPSGA